MNRCKDCRYYKKESLYLPARADKCKHPDSKLEEWDRINGIWYRFKNTFSVRGNNRDCSKFEQRMDLRWQIGKHLKEMKLRIFN